MKIVNIEKANDLVINTRYGSWIVEYVRWIHSAKMEIYYNFNVTQTSKRSNLTRHDYKLELTFRDNNKDACLYLTLDCKLTNQKYELMKVVETEEIKSISGFSEIVYNMLVEMQYNCPPFSF